VFFVIADPPIWIPIVLLPSLHEHAAGPGTPVTAYFTAINKQAEKLYGRAKFELVNQRVNAAIHIRPL
jgi:hypothetical protein